MKTEMDNVTLDFWYCISPCLRGRREFAEFFIDCSPVRATVHRSVAGRSGATGLQRIYRKRSNRQRKP
jgi:hypothetical protein